MDDISILGWTIPLKHWSEVQLIGHRTVLLMLLLQIITISAAALDLNVFLIMCRCYALVKDLHYGLWPNLILRALAPGRNTSALEKKKSSPSIGDPHTHSQVWSLPKKEKKKNLPRMERTEVDANEGGSSYLIHGNYTPPWCWRWPFWAASVGLSSQTEAPPWKQKKYLVHLTHRRSADALTRGRESSIMWPPWSLFSSFTYGKTSKVNSHSCFGQTLLSE